LQALKSFWLPSLAPESKALVDKPDAATICPATGKKLRLKDLTPVQPLALRTSRSERR
jgi:nitric oxide synthase-interacting protein